MISSLVRVIEPNILGIFMDLFYFFIPRQLNFRYSESQPSPGPFQRPRRGRRFDVMFCSWTLFHLADPLGTLMQLRQLLAPEGAVSEAAGHLRWESLEGKAIEVRSEIVVNCWKQEQY